MSDNLNKTEKINALIKEIGAALSVVSNATISLSSLVLEGTEDDAVTPEVGEPQTPQSPEKPEFPIPDGLEMVESDPGKIVTGPGDAIVDEDGTVWQIAGERRQVIIDGEADPTTENVIRLVYANGEVYQEAETWGWYYKPDKQPPWINSDNPLHEESAPASVVTPNPAPVDGGIVEYSGQAKSPPRAVKMQLIKPGTAVLVPGEFMGLHRSLHIPNWKPDGGKPIPAPKYPYGWVRSLKVEVDGREECGFWRSIEKYPGEYNWQQMDKWVDANDGHPLLWLIYGPPTFFQKYPGERSRWPSWPGIASPTNDFAALERYVKACKRRYGSKIGAFGVCNEPTLPWVGDADDFDIRWDPAFTRQAGNAPFWSGSARDLANQAAVIDMASGDTPVFGCAFVDQHRASHLSVDRFLNAPTDFGTKGSNHISALDVHWYDYSFTPETLAHHIDGYRKKLDDAGLTGMPIFISETGAEMAGRFNSSGLDRRAPGNIARWLMIAAAKGSQALCLYGHVSEDDMSTSLSNPADNPAVIDTLTKGYQLGGRVWVNAAVLDDNSVWMIDEDGVEMRSTEAGIEIKSPN